MELIDINSYYHSTHDLFEQMLLCVKYNDTLYGSIIQYGDNHLKRGKILSDLEQWDGKCFFGNNSITIELDSIVIKMYSGLNRQTQLLKSQVGTPFWSKWEKHNITTTSSA